MGKKSDWFKDNCAGKKNLRLENLPQETLRDLGFHRLPNEVHNEEILMMMITFCYTGSYSLPIALEHQAAPLTVLECAMLDHLNLHLLATKYDINDLGAFSLEKLQKSASKLRALRSRVYLATVMALAKYDGIGVADTLRQFAFEEAQRIVADATGVETKRDWVCRNCRTVFQVTYISRKGMGKDEILDECPNCTANGDGSDEDMEENEDSEDDSEESSEDDEMEEDTVSKPTAELPFRVYSHGRSTVG